MRLRQPSWLRSADYCFCCGWLLHLLLCCCCGVEDPVITNRIIYMRNAISNLFNIVSCLETDETGHLAVEHRIVVEPFGDRGPRSLTLFLIIIIVLFVVVGWLAGWLLCVAPRLSVKKDSERATRWPKNRA